MLRPLHLPCRCRNFLDSDGTSESARCHSLDRRRFLRGKHDSRRRALLPRRHVGLRGDGGYRGDRSRNLPDRWVGDGNPLHICTGTRSVRSLLRERCTARKSTGGKQGLIRSECVAKKGEDVALIIIDHAKSWSTAGDGQNSFDCVKSRSLLQAKRHEENTNTEILERTSSCSAFRETSQ